MSPKETQLRKAYPDRFPPLLESEIQANKIEKELKNATLKEKKREYARNYAAKISKEDKLAAQLKYTYNITLEYFNTLLKSQNNRCVGCGMSFTTRESIHVDHNHTTGKVRGLLCRGCNHAIGNVKENPNTLKSLITYLEYHQ